VAKKGKNPKDDFTIKLVGQNVRKYRKIRRLTMLDLAGACDVEYSTISKIELGQVNTTVTMLSRICKVLNVNASQLLQNESI